MTHVSPCLSRCGCCYLSVCLSPTHHELSSGTCRDSLAASRGGWSFPSFWDSSSPALCTLPCGSGGGRRGNGTARLRAADLHLAALGGHVEEWGAGCMVRMDDLGGTDPLCPGLLVVLSGVWWQLLPRHECAVPAQGVQTSCPSPTAAQAPQSSLRHHGSPPGLWGLPTDSSGQLPIAVPCFPQGAFTVPCLLTLHL